MSPAGEPGPSTRPPEPAEVLRLDQACIGYGERTVVRDLTLTIRQGEVVALLGTNGAGKSTVVRGLLGLADLQSGTVRLFGGEPQYRARVGYVPQRQTATGPVPALVREIVMTGRLSGRRLFVRPGRADREAVAKAIDVVGLTDHAGAAVTELSGGQHRRALIARALAGGPDLLVLDEPTAGVDASQQQSFVTTLQRLAARGVTMLIVTHELGPMLPVISRALVMDAGQLQYDGPVLPEHSGQAGGHHHLQPPTAPVSPDVPDLDLRMGQT